jgi:hypothetical protein
VAQPAHHNKAFQSTRASLLAKSHGHLPNRAKTTQILATSKQLKVGKTRSRRSRRRAQACHESIYCEFYNGLQSRTADRHSTFITNPQHANQQPNQLPSSGGPLSRPCYGSTINQATLQPWAKFTLCTSSTNSHATTTTTFTPHTLLLSNPETPIHRLQQARLGNHYPSHMQ